METEESISIRTPSFSCYLDATKENLTRRISAQENPTFILSSPKIKSPSTKPPLTPKFSHSNDIQENLRNLRVDSFSYLNKGRDQNLVFDIPNRTPSLTFSREIPNEGGEISVFGAEKYFNVKLECQTRRKHDSYKHEEGTNLPRLGSSIRSPKAPSLCSEASSAMNSQTALIQRNGSQVKQKIAMGRRIFRGFGCQGQCFGKRVVHINETVSTSPKPSRIGLDRIHHLPKPTERPIVKKQLQEFRSWEDPRISIEVFGSKPSSTIGDIATSMERKLSMLTWDAIPKGSNLPSTTVGSSTLCDDIASDASSDLFEIDSITGSMHPVRTPKEPIGPDGVPGCMSPQSHYAPSEASIQWSVVTASAADSSSVISYYNDGTSISVAGDSIARNIKLKHGGILGCKSQKSVEVADNVCIKSTNNQKAAQNKLNGVFGKSSEGNKGRAKTIQTVQLPRSYAMIH